MRKQLKDYYIAFIHYLIAGIVIPFMTYLVIGYPTLLLLAKKNSGTGIVGITEKIARSIDVETAITMSIIWLLGIWFGIICSTKYINKTYIIRNNKNIARLSTIYFVVLGSIYKLYRLHQSIASFVEGNLPNASILTVITNINSIINSIPFLKEEFVIDITFFIGGAIIFYILSKKYIRNNEITTT